MPNVHFEFYGKYLKMESESFNNFIKSCSNIQRVVISNSTINVDGELDFGKDITYQTQYLSFNCTSFVVKSQGYFNKTKDCIIKMLKAIKQSSLSNSLKQIDMYSCWDMRELKNIFKNEVELKHIQVLNRGENPYQYEKVY